MSEQKQHTVTTYCVQDLPFTLKINNADSSAMFEYSNKKQRKPSNAEIMQFISLFKQDEIIYQLKG